MEASFETLIGLMVVLVLFAFGLIAYLVRGVRKGRAAKAPPPPPLERRSVEPAPPPQSLALQGRPPVAAPSQPAGLLELPHQTPPVAVAAALRPAPQPQPMLERPGDVLLLQVWQDQDGFLVVEVGGKRYRRLFDIRDGEVGRRVLETIQRLLAFSRGETARVTPPAAQQEAAPAASVAGPLPQDVVWPELPDPLASSRPEFKKSRITVDPVPFRRRTEADFLGITLNLAEEIDQLLQVRVGAAGELGHRYIHVTNAPDGGLRFTVDGGHYGALDEIADPQVQALIRAAISDWEMRR